MIAIDKVQLIGLLLAPLLILLLAEVIARSRWNELIGRSLVVLAALVPAMVWLTVFLQRRGQLTAYARYALLLNILLGLGGLALPRRTVDRIRDVRFTGLGILGLNALLVVQNAQSFSLVLLALLVLLFFRMNRAARKDPIEREPARLFLIFQGVGVLLIIAGAFLSHASLPFWNESRDAWANLPTSSALLFAIGCWISCGLFPFSSSFLSVVSATRDNFVLSLLFVQAITVVCVRILVPLLLSHPSFHIAGGFIAALTMLTASLFLFVERQPRRVGALLFLCQLGFGLLSVENVASRELVGLWIAIELATAALAGVLIVSSFLLLRLGRGYSESCTGLASALPTLACCFLVCLLSFVGFPGTMGFVGEEILIRESFAERHIPLFVAALALAINGFSCFRLFGRIFLGEGSVERLVEFRLKGRERWALACVMAVLLIPGIFPELTMKLFLLR